jgi:gamma-glutamylcyclotransferase (GGCT)/AIG2-like uncharacterized protein YtfP
MDEEPTGLFAYGSLMWPAILARVCQGPHPHGLDSLPAAEAALLLDHVRLRVRGEDYPGLRPQPGAQVEGRLYRPLSDSAWPLLDAFEGDEYERVPVPVLLADGSRVLAWTYRFRAEMASRLLYEPWLPQDFEGAAMARFVARYAGFARPGLTA